MTRLEQSALEHVAAELAYQRSPKAATDLLVDRNRRIQADIKSGHRPACTLTKCAPDCSRP